MSAIADVSEPTSELEHLIADLLESGPLVFVFGDGFLTAHLKGATTPVFPRTGRPALVARRTRRRHDELDDERAGR